jgi:PAS domain-containing protein
MGAMRDYLSGTKPIYQVDYRIRKADGIYTRYMDRGVAIKHDGNGEPLVLRGIVVDLGEELQNRTKDKGFLSIWSGKPCQDVRAHPVFRHYAAPASV